ncbi:MAG: VOC family protein [Halodesulfovibrio sp.]
MTVTISPFETVEPVVRADALVGVRLVRQDVDRMSAFLTDFGFTELCRKDGSIFFRGFGSAPWCVEIRKGDEDSFTGFVLAAAEASDLARLAETADAPVEDSPFPGGGQIVTLQGPGGYSVSLAHGFAILEEQSVRSPIDSSNSPFAKRRINEGVRPPSGPSPVHKIGHVVLQVTDFSDSVTWFMRMFGFLPSDLLCTQGGHFGLGFLRLNRGEKPADHHTVALLAGPEPALLHISTETIDIDAVGQGQQHLRARGYQHHWGVGRHCLGSQFFDYWKDPAGDEWEHYADGDVMNADYPTGIHQLDRGGLWTWGDDLPPSLKPPGPAPAEAPEAVRELVDALLKPPRPWLD